MNDQEIRIYARNANPQMDSIVENNFSIKDLDQISAVSFKQIVSIRYPGQGYEELSLEEFLVRIGAMQRNRETVAISPTRGCLLFLGKYNSIRERYPSFHLDYFNRKGDNQRWVDRVATDLPNQFEMNVFNFYNIVFQKLNTVFSNEFQLDKQNIRVEGKQFDESIREAFVNALVHADYDMGLPSTKIEVLDGWIRFVNPGKMLISIPEFVNGGTSKPRNEILMKMFRLLGASERQGFGGPQIFKNAVNNRFRMPEVYSDLEQTELRIWHIDLVEAYPELTPEEKTVFRFIVKSLKPVSYGEILKETQLTEYKIRQSIKSLVDLERIEIKGKGQQTKYDLKLGSSERITQLQMLTSDIQKQTINYQRENY